MLTSKLSNTVRNMNALPCVTSRTVNHTFQTSWLCLFLVVQKSSTMWWYLKHGFDLVCKQVFHMFLRKLIRFGSEFQSSVKERRMHWLPFQIDLNQIYNVDCPMQPTSSSMPRLYLLFGASCWRNARSSTSSCGSPPLFPSKVGWFSLIGQRVQKQENLPMLS